MPAPATISAEILTQGIKGDDIPKLEQWGEYLARGEQGNTNRPGTRKMTTSQVRKFFGEIKRIQADFDNCKNDVILLDPKIAYSVGRARKESGRDRVAIEDFYNLLKPMLRSIGEDRGKFKHFVQVCEAIVAYHRAKGGE